MGLDSFTTAAPTASTCDDPGSGVWGPVSTGVLTPTSSTLCVYHVNVTCDMTPSTLIYWCASFLAIIIIIKHNKTSQSVLLVLIYKQCFLNVLVSEP